MSTFKKSIIGFLILFLWGIPFQIIAQSEINGIIKDKISSNPITGANVYLKEKKSGTSTNSEGIFKIENLNPGIYQLNISHVGYIDTSFNVNTENPQNLTIVLIPDSSGVFVGSSWFLMLFSWFITELSSTAYWFSLKLFLLLFVSSEK